MAAAAVTAVVPSPPLAPTALAPAVTATAAATAAAATAAAAAATPAAAATSQSNDDVTFEMALIAAGEAVDLLQTALGIMERKRLTF